MNATKLLHAKKRDWKRKTYNESTMRERTRFKALNPPCWKWMAESSYKNNEEGC